MNAPTTTDAAALLKVGAVVQVAVDEVDRGKVDDSNATLVVVELVVTGSKRKETKYRLAGGRPNRHGQHALLTQLCQASQEGHSGAGGPGPRSSELAGSPSGKFISK